MDDAELRALGIDLDATAPADDDMDMDGDDLPQPAPTAAAPPASSSSSSEKESDDEQDHAAPPAPKPTAAFAPGVAQIFGVRARRRRLRQAADDEYPLAGARGAKKRRTGRSAGKLLPPELAASLGEGLTPYQISLLERVRRANTDPILVAPNASHGRQLKSRA